MLADPVANTVVYRRGDESGGVVIALNNSARPQEVPVEAARLAAGGDLSAALLLDGTSGIGPGSGPRPVSSAEARIPPYGALLLKRT